MKRMLLLVGFLLFFCSPASASNFSMSKKGESLCATYTHISAIDSAHIVFAYPDTTNWYDSLFCYPVAWGSSMIMVGCGVKLDSIGTHIVKVRYYAGGSIAGHVGGGWFHDDDVVTVAGAGSDTFDIYVFNADTTAQEGVDICIYNEAKSAKVVPSKLTDVNGKAQVFLDAGDYPLYLQRLGVIYSQWDTITVSNGGIDSLWVTSYDPGSSPAGNLTTVKGLNRDFGFNKGDRLTITFSLPYKNVIDTSENVFIDRKEITVYSDTGYFEANLIPGIFLLSQVRGAIKDSLKYNVKIRTTDRPVFEWNRFDVPDTAGAVWLIDLIR